ncbi:transposase [Undibacterium sp. Di26W]|uniref:transposase n=1 Tax=Undibacterium sp. Di26W TaxID=3413035 RepID=UPI003BF3901F
MQLKANLKCSSFCFHLFSSISELSHLSRCPLLLDHYTSRGDRREDIYLDDDDRQEWLTVLAEVCDRFNWVVHAYCEMSNHYHLLVETLDGNLSRGMRQLNGLYTQRFNRRHKQVGHLFQGRYKAILIQKEAHLLELTRYIILNPVRAGMVSLPEQWHWSSYDFCVRDQHAPPWLDTDWLLGQFGVKRKQARRKPEEAGVRGSWGRGSWGQVLHSYVS